MPEPVSAADEAVLQRRGFLRGGALLAAAAGGAVAASAGSVLPASASPTPTYSITLAIPAIRLLDTQTEEGREAIVATSSSAFDSKHRLKKNAWLDLGLAPASELFIGALFVNVTSAYSSGAGSLTLYAPGEKPPVTTLSFHKGKKVSNGTVVGVGPVPFPGGKDSEDVLSVRIFASAVTHVSLDIVGASLVYGDSDPLLRTTSRRPQVEQVLKAVRAARR